MKFTHKSQMEIMGLAIIFILIGLGILFYLQFASQERPVFFQKTFKETQAVNNLLNIILATHSSDDPSAKASCRGKSFTDILEDCVTVNDDICFRQGTTENSCTFAQRELTKILDAQLKDKGQPYYFKAGTETINYIESPSSQKCAGSVRQGSVPLPIKGGILRLTLDLCI